MSAQGDVTKRIVSKRRCERIKAKAEAIKRRAEAWAKVKTKEDER